ncbi:hypothetical protein E1B28_009060 [Marasmius oreades]|uniref:Mannosyltransferase n=1 Tax=Marasmius oreades TaxID=181124 RepID=A0A9P7UTX2_9AGAR|nr:uncharacterized protein E1B28_009060 [Marasmius oreades]KAG7092731.1 hypothetical protein E1B28_009060 [Marasmius oreades]
MLFFASLACLVRVTNGFIWIYMTAVFMWRIRARKPLLEGFILDSIVTGLLALFLTFVLDTLYYGRATLTPFNFLRTNLSAVSLFYGSNPWHFYLSQALPILCTTALPFVTHGIWLGVTSPHSNHLKVLIGLSCWTIGIYSLAGHKEWRFIHPLLPIFHICAAKSLVDCSPKTKDGEKLPLPRRVLGFLLINVPVSAYIILLYCSGPISVMTYVRSLPVEVTRSGVGFLMPCHSTPGHAYLHRPQLAQGELWALGCEPPLQNQDLATYTDQTTVFFSDPYHYLIDRFPSIVNPSFPKSPYPASTPSSSPSQAVQSWRHEWPMHLVFFGSLLERKGVRHLLEERGYKEVWHGGRPWEGDGEERKGGVKVWRWTTGAGSRLNGL